jgi:hypothetical protein
MSALNGIVAGLFSELHVGGWHGWKSKDIASEAYEIADAMLAARSSTPNLEG